MKLYTYPDAPSPRRVQLFLAEKRLEIPHRIIDLRAGEHLRPEFAAINPALTVPALVLDDGTCLAEPIAICDYLEQIQPEPALIGHTPVERALVLERNHWVENNGLVAVMEGFRNRSRAMSDRALTGRRAVAQIAELAERGVQRYRWFLQDLDELLSASDHVAGTSFSMADITALVTIEFALWGIRVPVPEDLGAVQRWYRSVSARPAIAGPD